MCIVWSRFSWLKHFIWIADARELPRQRPTAGHSWSIPNCFIFLPVQILWLEQAFLLHAGIDVHLRRGCESWRNEAVYSYCYIDCRLRNVSCWMLDWKLFYMLGLKPGVLYVQCLQRWQIISDYVCFKLAYISIFGGLKLKIFESFISAEKGESV